MERRHLGRRVLALGVVLAAVGAASAGHTGATTEPGGTQTSGGTLVFGASNDPRILDPALASDGESLRVSGQIFETLVTTAPGSTEVVPLLAPEWSASDDGLDWTFELETGRHVPRRRAVQRRRGVLQLRPLVQLHRPAAAQLRRLLLAGHLRRLRRQRARLRRPRDLAVRELRSGRRRHRHPPPHRAVGGVPQRPRAAPVLDRQPQGAHRVRRRRGHPRRRRQPGAAGHVRHRAPDRHRTVHVRLVDPQRPPDAHPHRRLLGRRRRSSTRSSSGRSPTTPPACRRCRPARSTATTSSTRRTGRRSPPTPSSS